MPLHSSNFVYICACIHWNTLSAIPTFLCVYEVEATHSVSAVHCTLEQLSAVRQGTPSNLPYTGVLLCSALYSNEPEPQHTQECLMQSQAPQVECCASEPLI